jgi:chromosome segregation protein
VRLKSIDLQGFKSFTDKTKIQLEGGISCVVGPNGSGKSNIADAVRWVLGEQSAKTLRGHKMEDVIFSGSGKRKAVGMAEVALNIDNSDGSLPVEFAEVTVCRRAYRSGESEYLINGTQCRLKDIQEIFLDSGISNNSLCMVGQGRVQQIVDMKPEERRSLIEEAAGVIKYRNRKKTAVRKLNDTEKNLERVWDIISELADRLDPLAEQKEKAEKYLALKESADSQEINLLLQILSENKIKIDEINTKLKARNEQIINDENRFTVVNDETEVRKAGLIETENVQNQTQQQLFGLKTNLEKAEANKNLLAEKLKTANDNITRIQVDIDAILNRDDGFMLQVERLETECNSKKSAKDSLQVKIAEVTAKTNRQRTSLEELNGVLELSRDELFDLAGELANSKNELTYKTQEIVDNERSIEQTIQAKSDLQREKNSLRDQILDLEKNLADNKNIINVNRKKSAQLESEIHKITEEITAAAEAEVKSRMCLNSDQSRLKVLKELAENREGFYPGVRALLKAKKQNISVGKNIIGTVVDLIDLEQRYAVAVEAALASAMQNLIVRDDTAAKDAVRYLKEERLGRATFLPVNNLVSKNKRELDNAIGKKGVIGRVSEVVECSADVRPAIDFLLKNILLVENLDAATEIARENRQSFKIITLDGDVISPGGVISGGSKQKNTGDLLKKKAQLKELEKSVEQQRKINNECLERLEKLRKKSNLLSAEQQEISKTMRQAEITGITLEKDYNHLKDFSRNTKKQEQLFDLDLQEMREENQRLLNRKSEIEHDIANWEETNRLANEKIAELQKQIESEKKKFSGMQENLEVLKLDFVKKEQEYNNLHNEVERLHTEKSDLFQQEAEKRQALANWEKQLAYVRDLTDENQHNIIGLAADISDKENEYSQISNSVSSEKAAIKSLEREASELNHNLAVNKEEVHQLEIRVTRLQTEWDSETRKLDETFEMTYEEALVYLDTSVSRSKLARNVRELRKNIAALGNVNLNSIEEYNEVFARHEFLTAQRQDLLDAKASLKEVIKEMDTIVTKRFKQAFNEVNEEFNHTFSKLFGGGSAGLVMTLPDDVLETGIDMVVQPPGKKLVNYNLLSGGEKSLIGIALILAVFHVKPSPFCVLDEVDAALDEANVERFAQYLQEYTNQTQFLVVTHRQGTMEVASTLWGVTMASDGVSKIVSVKLSDMAS